MTLLNNLADELPYSLIIKRGSAMQIPGLFADRIAGKRLMLVYDREVAALYQPALKENFAAAGINAHFLLIDGSEAGKTVDTVRALYEQLADLEMSTEDLLVAFGGGSVIDVTAFAAQTYLGGLDYVQVPTTLLAMADSSTSPVCQLNYRSTKNLIGLPNQPIAVLIDVDLLKTLPPKHIANGFAQIIQFGYAMDPAIIEMLESSAVDLELLLTSALEAKLQLLKKYPIGLTFGQVIGDAIEGHFRFLKYLHGEALALGMLAAAPDDRLRRLLDKYHLPTRLEGVAAETLIRRMQRTAAQKGGKAGLIRICEPGRPVYDELSPEQAEGVYQELLAVLTGG